MIVCCVFPRTAFSRFYQSFIVMLANFFQKVSFRPITIQMMCAPLTGSQRCTLQIRYFILISNKTAKNNEKKFILLNLQQSKLFTSVAQMYRNTVIIYSGDRLNLQSGISFFTPQIQLFTEST